MTLDSARCFARDTFPDLPEIDRRHRELTDHYGLDPLVKHWSLESRMPLTQDTFVQLDLPRGVDCPHTALFSHVRDARCGTEASGEVPEIPDALMQVRATLTDPPHGEFRTDVGAPLATPIPLPRLRGGWAWAHFFDPSRLGVPYWIHEFVLVGPRALDGFAYCQELIGGTPNPTIIAVLLAKSHDALESPECAAYRDRARAVFPGQWDAYEGPPHDCAFGAKTYSLSLELGAGNGSHVTVQDAELTLRLSVCGMCGWATPSGFEAGRFVPTPAALLDHPEEFLPEWLRRVRQLVKSDA